MFNHPKVQNLFTKKGHTIHPAGSDNLNQCGPVKRGHQILANTVCTLLLGGTNLDTKFWPCAFNHALCMSNALPEPSQLQLSVTLATGKSEDFLNMQTFGCWVWVQPPGHCAAKLQTNSQKGIFLGCVPRTTHNILWCDVKTTETKIATHACFNEGMNNLPVINMLPDIAPPLTNQ